MKKLKQKALTGSIMAVTAVPALANQEIADAIDAALANSNIYVSAVVIGVIGLAALVAGVGLTLKAMGKI